MTTKLDFSLIINRALVEIYDTDNSSLPDPMARAIRPAATIAKWPTAERRAATLLRALELGGADAERHKVAVDRSLRPSLTGGDPVRHAKSKRLRQDWNRLVQCWTHELSPNLSRLTASGRRQGVEYHSLAEIACRRTRLWCPFWDAGEPEDGLAVELRMALLRPGAPLCREVKLTGTIGAHALGRRYERGGADDDRAVLADVFKLAQEWPEHANDRPGEFPAGLWAGFVGGVDRSLNSRTWLSGGPELFVDETGALRARWGGR